MYRFLLSPKWLAFHALCLAGVLLMVNLGFWQLNRLDQRKDFNAEVEAVIDSEPQPLNTLVPSEDADPSGLEWTPVTASGSYVDDQIVVFNRSQGGQAGDNVLTPLLLDDGDIVLVNRGFISPPGTPPPPPPSGLVEVLGRVRLSQGDSTQPPAENASTGDIEVRTVELDALATLYDEAVLPVYLDLVASTPPIGAGDPTPVPAPELSNGPHLSYAIQWFIFAASVVVGWVFAVRTSVRKRRRQDGAVDGSAPETAAPEPAAT